MDDYRGPLDAAIEVARAAGEILRNEFLRPGGPRGQGGHADADDQAEALIRERLLAAFPWRYLGEETGAGGDPSADHLWLVDPNDGTSAFLKGMRGSAVSIAGLRNGVPILGVVFAYSHPDDNGDLIAWAKGCGPVTRNGRPVEAIRPAVPLDGSSVVLVSHSADRDPSVAACRVGPARFRALPSIAYRLALAAVGEADAAMSWNGPSSWDYGGGHALIRGAGGALLDENGTEVTYSADGRGGVDSCFGGPREVAAQLARGAWDSPAPPSAGTPSQWPLPARRHAAGPAVPPEVLARAQGCILGQLSGDALGSRVEFRSAQSILNEHPAGVRELVDGGTFDTVAGQPTDDSEMALVLARTLVHDGAFAPEQALAAYVHWYRSRPFDIGNTTISALSPASAAGPGQALATARDGASTSSQSNGSLMRSSPLGVFFQGRPEEAARAARLDSSLTHPHPVCAESCAAFVAAIAAAIAGADSPERILEVAIGAVSGGEAGESVKETLERARHELPADFQTHQGWVLIALQNAFFRLLHSDSLEQGVIDTVMCGGDTDTTAAIAGALLGAFHGREVVPAQWRRAVLSCHPMAVTGATNPRPPELWPADALVLAEALVQAG